MFGEGSASVKGLRLSYLTGRYTLVQVQYFESKYFEISCYYSADGGKCAQMDEAHLDARYEATIKMIGLKQERHNERG